VNDLGVAAVIENARSWLLSRSNILRVASSAFASSVSSSDA
jgi:hypothetical protein